METIDPPHVVVLFDGYQEAGAHWTPWRERYTARGLDVLAPGWPGIDAIGDDYERFVTSLGVPTILMGHGFGGLVVQDLLDRGVGAVGVAIDSTVIPVADDRAPLLVIGGGLDHLAPASMAAVATKRFYRGGPITEYREFPAPTDASLRRDGWEAVADFALDWALAHAAAPARV